MLHGRPQRLLACLLLASALAAAETVILRNGFRLEADWYENGPDTARLLLSNGGWIEVPVEDVMRVESDLAPPGAIESTEDERPGTQPRGTLAKEIDRFADLAGLPRDLVRAVVWAESGARQDAVSHRGAVGLMQLMPETAAELGVDPNDLSGNLEGGTRYLRQMLERYEGDRDQLVKALAAYNAGPGSVAEHRGLPPYPETIEYVTKVVQRFLNTTPTGGLTR